jgi:hypothetical protein
VSADPNRRGVPVEFWLAIGRRTIGDSDCWPDIKSLSDAELQDALPGPWPEECFAGGYFHGLFADQPHQQIYRDRVFAGAKLKVADMPAGLQAAAEKHRFVGYVRAAAVQAPAEVGE